MAFDVTRVSGMPVPVFFAGFESNTLRLQQEGWDLSAEQDPRRAMMRLALRHSKARMFALTSSVSYRDMHFLEDHRRYSGALLDRCPVEFHVISIFNEGRVQVFAERSASVKFQPIDATPFVEHLSYSDVKFEDYVPFRTINPDAPEIFVPERSVPELLELALKLQEPAQAEIRERRRREDWRKAKPDCEPSEGRNDRADIRAQIMTLAG